MPCCEPSLRQAPFLARKSVPRSRLIVAAASLTTSAGPPRGTRPTCLGLLATGYRLPATTY